MKTAILVAAMVACTLSASIVSAQEKAAPAKPAAGMGMNMDKQMPQIQENMKKMQQQMEQIRATADPVEGQKLTRGLGVAMMMGGGQLGGMITEA